MSVQENSKTLRRFHNYIKFLMYQKYCKPEDTLLDLGCGRGGDMFKWEKVGIKNVVGIDVNKNFVIDAIKRYKNNSACLKDTDYRFYFTHEKYIFCEFLRYRNLQCVYNNISCMFALHYFFDTKEHVSNLFSQISACLKKGGYFFGTVMNGVKVNDCLKTKEIYNSHAMFIKKDYTEVSSFGTKIQFMLSGTLYFGEKTLSTEYLVFEHTLKMIGDAYDLNLIEFKCFEQHYTEDFNMDQDFKDASFLNYTFAFQKS